VVRVEVPIAIYFEFERPHTDDEWFGRNGEPDLKAALQQIVGRLEREADDYWEAEFKRYYAARRHIRDDCLTCYRIKIDVQARVIRRFDQVNAGEHLFIVHPLGYEQEATAGGFQPQFERPVVRGNPYRTSLILEMPLKRGSMFFAGVRLVYRDVSQHNPLEGYYSAGLICREVQEELQLRGVKLKPCINIKQEYRSRQKAPSVISEADGLFVIRLTEQDEGKLSGAATWNMSGWERRFRPDPHFYSGSAYGEFEVSGTLKDEVVEVRLNGAIRGSIRDAGVEQKVSDYVIRGGPLENDFYLNATEKHFPDNGRTDRWTTVIRRERPEEQVGATDNQSALIASILVDNQPKRSGQSEDLLTEVSEQTFFISFKKQEAACACCGGPAEEMDIDQLVRQIEDRDPFVRRAAVEALGRRGADAPGAVGAVAECLKDEDEKVQRLAVEALGHFGEAAAHERGQLQALLDNEDTMLRVAAARSLGRIGGSTEHVLLVLMKALESIHPWTAAEAARALGEFDELPASAIKALQAATAEQQPPPLRVTAAAATWRVTNDRELALSVLTEVIKDSNTGRARTSAACELGAMGSAAEAAVPILLQAIRDESMVDSRSNTLASPEAERTTRPERPADRDFIAAAMTAICRIRGDQEAAPTILSLTDMDTLLVAHSVVVALSALGPEAAPSLFEAFREDDDGTVFVAANAIRAQAAEREYLLPHAAELLKSSSPQERAFAATVFGIAGEASVPYVAKLQPLLRDYEAVVRLAAADALWQITGDAATARSVFAASLSDPRATERLRALDMLASLGQDAAPVLDELVGALDDENALVRWLAIQTIGHLGDKAQVVLPQIRMCLEDEIPLVGESARRAVERLSAR
jgi:HEAT repeat protein